MLNQSNNQVVEIAQKVFELLTQGSFTNTYKYATLLGILEALEERSTADGPPSMITSRELAEHVLRLYWPQCDGFRDDPELGLVPLAQQSGEKQPKVITAILKWRTEHPGQTIAEYISEYRRSESAFRETKVTRPARTLMNDIERTLIKFPIPLLQWFGKAKQEFLFKWNMEEQPVGIGDYQAGRDSPIDNTLRFKPGVPQALLTLSPLLRSMIQTEWTRLVAGIRQNNIEANVLHTFLFDHSRVNLNDTRAPLRELQQRVCFYCGELLVNEAGHVDHFVPWSRHPNNAIENLVVAHASCNISKSNYLAAPEHLQRWKERL
ncbi:MAG: HNH endonuclease, partial [Myxococcales bacterium]|nr:HNH endonuclease [Myxococcales bacterium]